MRARLCATPLEQQQLINSTEFPLVVVLVVVAIIAVPDKDLNAGVVPTALIAPSLRKDLEMQPTERVTLAPSDGRPMGKSLCR